MGFEVQRNFTPKSFQTKALNLKKGDLVVFDSKDVQNGWVSCYNKTTAQSGMIPVSTLMPLPMVVDIGTISMKYGYFNGNFKLKTVSTRISFTENGPSLESNNSNVYMKGFKRFINLPLAEGQKDSHFQLQNVEFVKDGNIVSFTSQFGIISAKEILKLIFQSIKRKSPMMLILLPLGTPYYQKLLLENTAKLARFESVAFMYQTTGVALAASAGVANRPFILVVSSGAQYTDIALFTKKSDSIQMVSSEFTMDVSGQMITRMIFDHVSKKLNLENDWQMRQLYNDCEIAKCMLSTTETTDIPIPNSEKVYRLSKSVLEEILGESFQ
jgi:molecular chaperone DnaK (HSP70)